MVLNLSIGTAQSNANLAFSRCGYQRSCRSRPYTRPNSSRQFRWGARREFSIKAVAEATREEEALVKPLEKGSWHAVVANADFMLHDVQNESFAEQLRERRRLFTEKGMPLDFWIVSEPAWLDKEFPQEAARIRRPCVALVSTDEIWMNFMKLRLDRVLQLKLGEKNLDEVVSSNGPLPDYEPLDRQGKWTAPYPPYRPGWWKVFMRD